MTPNKNPQPGAERPPAGRTSCRRALAVGPTPNLTPLGVGREGTRECASVLAQPQPWANRDRHCLGQEPRAQSHLPNGLFQKVKEKGPEQPYTKYSVASSKGCTEFLALRSTECVSLLRVPSPQLPGSPQQGRGLALNSPPNTPSLGRVQRKA